MKIFCTCLKCSIDNLDNNLRFLKSIPIKENDLYHFKCNQGHDNLLEIQAFKFEMLFESGLCAIKDKYYLESVLSLTASNERFYEFFIRIIMRENGLNKEIFENLFKNMSKQSERQYGAFVAIYGLIFKEDIPKKLKNKSIEFRNKVVHKGYLPSENEVLEYAEEIFELIKFYYIKILSNYDKEVFNYLFDIQKDRRNNNKDLIKKLKVNISIMAPPFALSHTLNLESFKEKNFKNCYELIKINKFYE